MVSYGDREFQQWAEELNLNDEDLSIWSKAVNKRKRIWFLIYLLGCLGGCLLSSLPETLANALMVVSEICGMALIFVLPFFLESWAISRFLKYGTLNVHPNIIWTLLYICLFISFISIITLIIWKLTKKNLWGTGFRKLVKKGIICNH